MSETSSIQTIGGTIAVIGIIVLLIGLAMPATSTHTSETCINDPTGFGQNCVSGSVTTPNPLRGPVMGIGFLALLGGIGITFLGGRDSQPQDASRTSRSTSDGSFAEQLRDRQENEDTEGNQHSLMEGSSAGTKHTSGTTNIDQLSKGSGSWASILPQNPLVGYSAIMLIGGIFGYVILFSLASALNFVLSFWMGALAGLFAAHHIYHNSYTTQRAIEIPLAFFGAWYGTGVLYQAIGPLPRGIFGMLILGGGAFISAGIGVAAWRLVGEPAIESVWDNWTQ